MKWISRRLLFWLVLVFGLGGFLAWLFWPGARPTFRFVEFREINGERYGLFVLENGTASKIIYDGKTGTPQVHYRIYLSDTVLTDGGMHVEGGRGGGTLEQGERVEFVARLRMGSRRNEVREPFQTAIKFTTPARVAFRRHLLTLGIPRRYLGDDAVLLWTETIAP